MNERFIESRKAVANAREALKNGAMTEARQWAEHAAELMPQSEDPWLILAAVVSPRESVQYIRKALEMNPDSPRAKQGMEWAMKNLGETSQARVSPVNEKQAQSGVPMQSVSTGNALSASKGQTRSKNVKNPKKRNSLLPILLVLMGFAVFLFAAWSAVRSPVLASILNASSAPQVEQRKPFAQVNIAKPAAAIIAQQSIAQKPVAQEPVAQAAAPTATFTAIATTSATQESQAVVVSVLQTDIPPLEPTLEVVTLPTETPFVQPAPTQPEVASESGVVSAQIISDTPTPEFTQPTVAPYVPPQVVSGDGVHWIDVDLSQQRLYAYAGDTLMNSFIVSTGTWQTPTVTGKFKIWVKVRSQAMSGPGYYLPDVPYVMFFYKDYGLHGTYWHNNFGTPMSHGCVNLTIPDAEWLYNFSSVGTVVNVHY
jgi:lipoprotein-anchoring transpeptidase ErfK/SrfK